MEFHSKVKNWKSGFLFTLVSFFIATNTFANPEISGVYGMDSLGQGSWLAIKIEIPENQALSGILFYNNDGEVIFPTLKVGTGFPDSPGFVGDFTTVAEGIQGVSSGWSEVHFSEPLGASLESLYLAVEFPPGQVLESRGTGGGPGFGYFLTNEGCPGWLSGEGEVWGKLHSDLSFAVEPVFVPYENGMAIKSADEEIFEPEVTEYFLNPTPNPFNPQTRFSFGLVKDGNVSIIVYDVRGRLVVNLHEGLLSAGRHHVQWLGCDASGRNIASGVYFVRMVGEGVNLSKKVLLVR